MSFPDSGTGKRALTTGRTVIGLFADRSRAEGAIRDLRRGGFTDDQIGMAMVEPQPAGTPPPTSPPDGVAEGTAVGALTGGVLGGLVGLLGSLLLPGIGPILVGGMMATLWGAGIGVATGGFIGALVSIGVPESDAAHFDAGLRAGGVLVSVTPGTRLKDALEILERHEADLGPSRGERRRPGRQDYAGPERRLSGV